MHVPRRRLLVVAAFSFAVLISAGLAVAALPTSPLPPLACNEVRFTGSVSAAPARCADISTTSNDQPGPRGQRGLRGRTGPVGERGAVGRTGTVGPIGLTGVAGVKGDRGDTGGAPGPQGSPGAQGAVGATGLQGSVGVTGADGPVGPQGPAGSTGAAGTNGAAGVAGPAGPAGGLAEYAYVYNLAAGVVAIEAPVNFSSNGVMTAGITHAPAAPGIVLVNAGDYKVTFSVSGVEPNQMALFVNGAVVAGSVYGSGAGTQQTTGQVIITASAGDVLTVVNHSSAAAVTLQTLAGGTQTNANASVTIEKLA
jgi:hypothetical protein